MSQRASQESSDSPKRQQLSSKLSEPFDDGGYEDQSTFDVVVSDGPNKIEHFTLPVAVFVQRSNFFHKALQTSTQAYLVGKVAQPIFLPIEVSDDDADYFSDYLRCVRHGTKEALRGQNIDDFENDGIGDDSDDMSNVEIDDEMHFSTTNVYNKMIKLYALATKLQDYNVANQVIDEIFFMHGFSNAYPAHEAAALAYKLTPEGDLLRTLIYDFWACSGGDLDQQIFKSKDIPYELLLAVAYRTFDIKEKVMGTSGTLRAKDFEASYGGGDLGHPKNTPTCRYHKHDNKNPKYAKCSVQDPYGHW